MCKICNSRPFNFVNYAGREKRKIKTRHTNISGFTSSILQRAVHDVDTYEFVFLLSAKILSLSATHSLVPMNFWNKNGK
jgi:hypothetical protein